jgi:peptidoglycan/xylan/chitin deacetylase (PgdA/CDA1 family)
MSPWHKNAACALLYLSGVVHVAYWLNRHRQIVVTYHNVLPDRMLDDSLHSLEAHSESVFAKQLSIISRRFPITTELGLPGTCVITFDDGYSNNVRIAAPLLARWGALAYFFVPLETARRQEPNWVDKLRLWLGAAPAGRYQVLKSEIAIDDHASRHRAADLIWKLIEADYPCYAAALEDMEHAIRFDDLPIDPELRSLRYAPIPVSDLRALADTGHRIAAHSRAHDILSRLPEKDIEADFSTCMAENGPIYNTSVYAYPFGGPDHVDEKVVEACRSAGFAAALLFIPSLDGTGFTPGPFTIPRCSLPNTANRFVIEMKLSGLDVLMKRLAHHWMGSMRFPGAHGRPLRPHAEA